MAAKGVRTGKGKGNITLIRKEEVIEGAHHGGAWKVAYADFVTAMMAFFLLMWLLNATTEEQRRGIADYFSPIAALGKSVSGTGLPFGGRTPYSDGAMASDRGAVEILQGRSQPIPDADQDDSDTPATPRQYARTGPAEDQTDGAAKQALGDKAGAQPATGSAEAVPLAPLPSRSPDTLSPATGPARPPAEAAGLPDNQAASAQRRERERAQFAAAAEQIRQAVQADPQLTDMARQLSVDITPAGLRIQILDEDRQPMFATGSAVPNERARLLLEKVAPTLQRLSGDIAIVGHTDAAPYRGGDRTNWELSAERANATRRLLADAGLPDQRIRSVAGDADRDLLLPGDPLAAANRRIAIFVLRDAAVRAPGAAAPAIPAAAASGPADPSQAAPPSAASAHAAPPEAGAAAPP